jgi:tripartite-type tricarboxylate transporter receptor subunit TctC
MSILRLVTLTFVCTLQLCTASFAQDYPNRPIRVVVPFPPGGPTDGMARIVSDQLGKLLGQTVVVDNRGGGAGGSVGAKSVATAEPDGYSILMTPGGSLTSGPAVHKNIGYDPADGFHARRPADHYASVRMRASNPSG